MSEESRGTTSRVPVDHGWAWVVVAGCFGGISIVVGILKSFGVLFVELSERLDVSASLLASTQSLCGYLHLSLATLANILARKFGYRKVAFCGGIISAVGLIASGYVDSIEWFFVTYGLITGFGFGITLGPCLVFPGFYFDKRLPIATGLASAGSGFGSFIFPNLMRYLMDQYSVDGCLLILGGISLNVCICASVLLPTSWWDKYRGHVKISEKEPMNSKTKEELPLYSQKHNVLKLKNENTTNISEKANSVPCLWTNFEDHELKPVISENTLSSQVHKESTRIDKVIMFASLESIPIEATQIKSNKKEDKQGMIDWKLLTNPHFQVLNVAVFLAILSHHCVFNFVPSLADEFGFTEAQGALCVSIVGATDLIGRICSGFIAGFCCNKRIRMYQLCLLLYSCFVMIIAQMENFIAFVIVCGLVGLTTGGFIGVQISMIAEQLGRENLAKSWGYIALFASLSILINPPMAGAIKDNTGSWVNAFRMASVSGLIGVVVMCLEPLLHRLSKYRKQQIKLQAQ